MSYDRVYLLMYIYLYKYTCTYIYIDVHLSYCTYIPIMHKLEEVYITQ